MATAAKAATMMAENCILVVLGLLKSGRLERVLEVED